MVKSAQKSPERDCDVQVAGCGKTRYQTPDFESYIGSSRVDFYSCLVRFELFDGGEEVLRVSRYKKF